MLKVIPLFLLLGACASPMPASTDGTCDVFTAPSFVIKGQTKHDQYWIDDQIESGVAACGWKRPRGRPK